MRRVEALVRRCAGLFRHDAGRFVRTWFANRSCLGGDEPASQLLFCWSFRCNEYITLFHSCLRFHYRHKTLGAFWILRSMILRDVCFRCMPPSHFSSIPKHTRGVSESVPRSALLRPGGRQRVSCRLQCYKAISLDHGRPTATVGGQRPNGTSA